MNDPPAGYTALRESVAYRKVPRDVVELTGPEAQSYLQGQCSQDVVSLGNGSSADALLLNPDGKLVALVRVSRLADDRFVVDVDGGFGDLVIARLGRFRLRTKVTIEALDWTCVSLRGPVAPEVDPHQGIRVMTAAGSGGFTGLDLLGPDPAAAVPASVPEAGPQAWEARRIESGSPMMGRELDERTIAAEADLLERAVSFTKGCYTGQELVARLDARGNKVARHLRGLVFNASVQASPGEGAAVSTPEGRSVGSVTSTVYSPALSRWLALGYVHRSVSPGDEVLVGEPATPGSAAFGAATVVTLPAAEPIVRPVDWPSEGSRPSDSGGQSGPG